MKIVSINQSEIWDGIVKSFPNYDVYYLSGYVKAFQAHGDGEPILLYYEKNHGRGICVLMKRDVAYDPLFTGKIKKGEYFDAVTPYGYGGFIFDGSIDTETFVREFKQVLTDIHVNSVFFRFHPVLDNAKLNEKIVSVIPLGKTIVIDLTSPKIIWENIISKNRNMIRKAEKSGVKIYHSDNPRLLENFREIYDKTMRIDNADDYYFFEDAFYDSLTTDLKGHFQLFYAVLGSKIISIAIMIYANEQLHYHLSGSLLEYRSFAPSNLLLYKAALWGHEHGFKTFHLGGGVGSEEDPLYKFKAAFNRNSNCHFAVGKSVIDNDEYNSLLRIRNFSSDDVSSISYFPQYRVRIN